VQAPKGPVQVRRDYNPKASQTGTGGGTTTGQDQFLISPITGEKIPAEKMQQHMRYGQEGGAGVCVGFTWWWTYYVCASVLYGKAGSCGFVCLCAGVLVWM